MSREDDLLFVLQVLKGRQNILGDKSVVQIILRLIDNQQPIRLRQQNQE